MGKRELIIIAAFALIGVVAYQFTAPAPKEGEEGFSLRKIFSEFKREVSSNSAVARVTKSGTIALRPDVKALRISAELSVPVTVIGESRSDISYEMPVESTGPDEASARGYAERSLLREDDLGAVLGLTTAFPARRHADRQTDAARPGTSASARGRIQACPGVKGRQRRFAQYCRGNKRF
jgi:hypothetical protein